MGVAAQVDVHPGVRQLLKLSGLVVHDDDGFAQIHLPGDFLRGLAHPDAPAGPAVVRPAVEIEGVLDQHALLPQQPDARLLQEFVHPGVAGLLLFAGKGEPRQHFFPDVMVAIAGVDAVSAPDAPQNRRKGLRILQRFILIVEDIPGHDYNIGVLLVDQADHLLHVADAYAVSQVEICHQHDFQLLHARGLLVHIQLIFRHPDMVRTHDSGQAAAADTEDADRADCHMSAPGEQPLRPPELPLGIPLGPSLQALQYKPD